MRGSGVLASDGGSDFRSGGRKAVLAGETGRGLGVQKRDAGQMSHIIAAFPYYLEGKGLPCIACPQLFTCSLSLLTLHNRKQ